MVLQSKRTHTENLFTNTIWRHFSHVKDPIVQDNQKYPFSHLIITIVCAMICGANHVEAIVDYIDSKIDLFREKLGIKSAPSYSVIWWLLVMIKPEELNNAFKEFVEEAKIKLVLNKQESEAIAIDGKTSRGTSRKGLKALHMVSAWSSSLNILLGQVKTAEKSNEITAIPELLKLLDIEGKVITIDAMGCQAAIADQIVEKRGDYILALKGNQETIHKEVKALFHDSSNESKNVDVKTVEFEEASEIYKGHGRIEERTARICNKLEWLKQAGRWTSVNSAIEITSSRLIQGQKTVEKRYYLSSLKGNPKSCLKWIRGHWGVESFHWVLDVAFKSDDFQGHSGHLAENFSLLQRLTLMMLKQETSSKKSMPQKRACAGWNDEYLFKLLSV